MLPAPHACTGHAVQFYHSDTFLVSAVADYLAAGMHAGAPAVAIATERHRRDVVQQLHALGADPDAASRAGLLTMLDARATLATIMTAEGPDSARFHSVIGPLVGTAMQRGRDARIYGEMVDLLWRDGDARAALALERLWNELLSLHPCSLLCAYAMDNFGCESASGGFDQLCREHTHVLPTETYTPPDERGRLAEIARLQQRAVALEGEVGRRRTLEGQLRDTLAERDSLLERERTARAEAEAANEAKSVFLAAMSHELRTPLNAIAGYVDLLRSGVYGTVADAQRRPLDRIQHSQRHLLTMINDVLNFAKIGVGHVEYQRDVVPLRELFAQAEALVLPQFDAHGIALRFEPCECTVTADRDRTMQILLNLLSNALKFTGGCGRVDVTAGRVGDSVEAAVRDTGCGIPLAQMDAIFDPFVQVGRRLSQPRDGVGLGLAISRDLARAMGGDLRAESEEGVGSVFTLALPVA